MKTQKSASTFKLGCRILLAAVLIASSIRPGLANASTTTKDNGTGFLVLTADRGFMGNEEIVDAFDAFAKDRNASLVFVTDERTRKHLGTGLDKLVKAGAQRIVTIPLFISAAAPRYQLARQLLAREKIAVPVSYARPYGESLFAVEDLADKLRTVGHPTGTRLVVVGYGAVDKESGEKMRADLKRVVEKAADGFGFSSIQVLIAHDKKDEEAEKRTAELKQALVEVAEDDGNGSTVVVPFHFGPRFDSMMSFNGRLQRLIPAGVELIMDSSSDGPNIKGLTTWLEREANRSQPLAKEDIGVVFLSHGADFNWNESMREAVQPLSENYKIEFAFSMADQATIERAIRKLEQRGAKAAVIVRVFALEESFRSAVDRMIGLDIEGTSVAVDHAGNMGHGHSHAHGHGHGTTSTPPPRIRTALPVQSAGGIGSSPLFAAALLDRARSLSKNPERDTVILVAHGSGSDRLNEQWEGKLETIAEHMRKAGGEQFLAIKVATWREDWPDKRGPWVQKIRGMVEDAAKQGGRAIVIPARTTGEGPEKKLLSGLEYDLGSGFAPHPMFVQWVEEKIKAGVSQFPHNDSAGLAMSIGNH